jgi:hypothetical protein
MPIETVEDINPKALREEASQQEIDRVFEAGAAVNLDEVNIESVTVTLMEKVPEEVMINGHKVKRNKIVPVTHEISCYVPMYLLNRLVAEQKKMQKMRARIAEGELESQEDPMMEWVTKQVLNVWKLTEEDMTYERLSFGLDFEKTFGLFARFFGPALRRLRTKALTV